MSLCKQGRVVAHNFVANFVTELSVSSNTMFLSPKNCKEFMYFTIYSSKYWEKTAPGLGWISAHSINDLHICEDNIDAEAYIGRETYTAIKVAFIVFLQKCPNLILPLSCGLKLGINALHIWVYLTLTFNLQYLMNIEIFCFYINPILECITYNQAFLNYHFIFVWQLFLCFNTKA